MVEYKRVRDNLKTLNFQEVLTSQITDASKVLRLSLEAIPDALDLNAIGEAWRSVHALTYGNTLPNTGVQVEGLTDGDGLEPGDNEVFQVQAVGLGNQGADTIVVMLSIGDVPLVKTPVDPGTDVTTTELGAFFPIMLSKGNALKFTVTQGTGSDLDASVSYNKTVQN